VPIVEGRASLAKKGRNRNKIRRKKEDAGTRGNECGLEGGGKKRCREKRKVTNHSPVDSGNAT